MILLGERGLGDADAETLQPAVQLSVRILSLNLAHSCGQMEDLLSFVISPWKNGKEVPRWGVAEIQKMSP